MNKKIGGHLVLFMILANVLLGTNIISLRIGTETMDPAVFAAIRYLGIGLLFLIFFNSLKHIKTLKSFGHIIVSAFLVSLFFVLVAYGVDMAGALRAGIYALLTPIFMYIFAVTLLGEPLKRRLTVGIALGLVGGLIMIGGGAIVDGAFRLGDLLLVTGFAFLALTIIHTKYLYKTMKPMDIIGSRMTIGGFMIIAFVLVTNGMQIPDLSGVSAASWYAVAFGTIVSGFIAFVFYYYILERINAEDAAGYFFIDPLTATVLSVLLLSEPLTGLIIAGGSIILLSVWISHPHKFKKLRIHPTHHL